MNCVNRECLPEIKPEYYCYFGVHSHDLGLIKESAPRVVNLDINIGVPIRYYIYFNCFRAEYGYLEHLE